MFGLGLGYYGFRTVAKTYFRSQEMTATPLVDNNMPPTMARLAPDVPTIVPLPRDEQYFEPQQQHQDHHVDINYDEEDATLDTVTEDDASADIVSGNVTFDNLWTNEPTDEEPITLDEDSSSPENDETADETGYSFLSKALSLLFAMGWYKLNSFVGTSSKKSIPFPDPVSSDDHITGRVHHHVTGGVPPKTEPTTWMVDYYDDNLDLSAYESLKATELRRLLRERNCNATGTKEVMIRRLVTVKQAELSTLTVRQLRPKLRARGCVQSGTKADSVRRLVEAGPY
jgi:hypothetical protein